MAIDKKLIHFKTWNNFISGTGVNGNYTVPSSGTEDDGTAIYGQIKGTSIVFIKDVCKMWTHGALYDCSSHEMLIVDEEISEISTNPVQNKVVKKYIDSKIFVGTQVEYDAVADDIAEGCIVIITDQSISEPEAGSGATSAVLGKGVLGQLILGKV